MKTGDARRSIFTNQNWMQYRGLLSIVSGTVVLSNISSLIGVLLAVTFDLTDLSKSFQILVGVAIQTFSIILGTVYWKLRLNDKRPDLLISIHDSIYMLTSIQLIAMIIFGFNLPKANLSNWSLVPTVILSFYFLQKIKSVDILSSRHEMLKASLILDCFGLCLSLTDSFVKYVTSPPPLYQDGQLVEGSPERDLVVLMNLILLICMGRVFYLWILGGKFRLGKYVRNAVGWNNRSDPAKKNRKEKRELDAVNVLPLDVLESLHFWNLVASFACMLGSPSALLFLTAGVYVGTTIRTTISNEEDAFLFFAKTAGQKRGDVTF